MTGTLKHIAVVGCGYWGKNLVRNFYELGALRVICDPDRQTLAALSTQFDVEAVTDFKQVLAMPDVKAVVVATPAVTHADVVLQALAAGKDVFVEKPLALKLEDAWAIQAAVRAQDRILIVGHLLEYHPALVKLRQLVAEGKIGQIEYLYSNRLSFGKVRTEENVLWSFMPHDICMILGFTGNLPTSVQSAGSAHVGEAEDFCVVNLEFENNIKAHIFASWLHPFKEHRFVVVGDKGMAVFDDVSVDAKLTLYDRRAELQDGFPILTKNSETIVPIEPAEPLKLECEHFLSCIATRQTPLTDVKNGIDVLTVLQAAQVSLESKGQIVSPKEMAVVGS